MNPRRRALRVAVDRVDQIAPEDRDAIVNGLRAYNTAHGVRGDWRELSVVARNERGDLVGGLLGETGLDWLFVASLWVAEAHRGSGVGRALLAEAEAEARRRGCIGVYLDTLSFQARPFYERLGYRHFGTLSDYPRGAERFFLYKRFDEVTGPRRVARKRPR